MLSTAALTALKNCIKDNVAYAEYKVSNTYHRSEINSAEITSDGKVAITFLIDHTVPGNITVSEVRLMNHTGTVWASKAESISRKDSQEGILYRFTFTVTET